MSKDKTNIEEITPKEIYLQAFTDDGLSYKDAGEEVTWCEDKVSDEDIKYIREDQVQAECEKPILKHIDERLKQHRDNLELWNNGTLTPTAEDEQDIELTKEGLKACIYELSELKDFIQKGAKGV